MDVPQLKLLAGLARGLLEQHNVSLGHAQSLELISALPGLRNWSEVMAFPDRVARCELALDSAARLANRMARKHGVTLTAAELLAALSPPKLKETATAQLPLIWPTGPNPGVYVTTNPEAILRLLEQYEDATDGELVYAERAGSQWEGSIDLGDYGLSSNGLSRVPSGTLIVVGPLELTQQEWENSADKVGWACLHAYGSGHRVAVLLDTASPDQLMKDVELLARRGLPEGSTAYEALAGVVSDDGELVEVQPFIQSRSQPQISVLPSSLDALPTSVIEPLKAAFRERQTGFLSFCTNAIQEHRCIEQIEAALALSPDIGPIARIKPRNRSTPEKDWMVPQSIQQLPFLPSIESAYGHGYRRLIVDPYYTRFEDMAQFMDEVLFVSGAHGLDVSGALIASGRGHVRDADEQVIEHLVALIGIGEIASKNGVVRFASMFVRPEDYERGTNPVEAAEYVDAHRIIRWEDEVSVLLDKKLVSLAAAKDALRRTPGAEEFFKARAAKAKVNAE